MTRQITKDKIQLHEEKASRDDVIRNGGMKLSIKAQKNRNFDFLAYITLVNGPVAF